MFSEFPSLLEEKPRYLGIVGSRKFRNIDLIEKAIDAFPVGTPIVTGDAKGVDTVAYLLGKELGNIPVRVTACWEAHGRSAGHRRNPVIIDIATSVIAFWDGESAGTLNSIRIAFTKRKPCLVVYDDPDGRWEYAYLVAERLGWTR